MEVGEPAEGRLIIAAIAYVFTIRRAAQILGRDENLLWELMQSLEPEGGKLWVYDVDGEVPAVSELGMETLRQIIKDQIDRAPRALSRSRKNLRPSPYAYG